MIQKLLFLFFFLIPVCASSQTPLTQSVTRLEDIPDARIRARIEEMLEPLTKSADEAEGKSKSKTASIFSSKILKHLRSEEGGTPFSKPEPSSLVKPTKEDTDRMNREVTAMYEKVQVAVKNPPKIPRCQGDKTTSIDYGLPETPNPHIPQLNVLFLRAGEDAGIDESKLGPLPAIVRLDGKDDYGLEILARSIGIECLPSRVFATRVSVTIASGKNAFEPIPFGETPVALTTAGAN